MAQASAKFEKRPLVVMLCNAQTPYRVALHLRIARELPQVRLMSLFTHETSNSPWSLALPPEIGPVNVGNGEPSSLAPRRPVSEWKKGGRIIELLEKDPPALVVLHGYNDAARWRVLRWCHSHRIPVYLWADSNIRSDHAAGIKRAVKGAFIRSVLSKTAGTFVCGSLGKAFFVSYGADPASILYMPYEPDYAQIQQLSSDAIRDTAQRFQLVAGRRRLIYSGRFVAEKRVDLLLQAWNSVAMSRPDWELLLIGDGPLRQELEAAVLPDLKARTRFLGFQSEQQVVSALYRNADALCLPSSYEPWALVINEAAAAGLAIVASDVVGAAAELVRDGVNGKLFKVNDLSDLKNALLTVTDSANIDRLQRGSASVLADWRREADPVGGLRKALSLAGIS